MALRDGHQRSIELLDRPRQEGSHVAMAIRIEKAGEKWRVVGEEHGLDAWWSDLRWAAYSALTFAEHLGQHQPQLGDGVPDDALTQGFKLKAVIDYDRAKASSAP